MPPEFAIQRLGRFARFEAVSFRPQNPVNRTIFFPGIGGYFHAGRTDVKHLLAKGHEIVGLQHGPLIGKLPLWARITFEALRPHSVYEPRRQLFERLAGEEPRPRLGLLAQSLASFSTTRMAIDLPDHFAAIDSYVHKSFALGSSPEIAWWQRGLRSFSGVERSFRGIQNDARHLGDVLRHHHIPICLVVPLEDEIVNPQLTRDFFHSLGPKVEKRAVLMRGIGHDIYYRGAPNDLKAYVCDVIEAALAKKDLPEIADPRVQVVKGDERWLLT